MRRVVVTGLGMVTPLGCGVKQTWERLIAGQSGAVPIDRFDVSDLPARVAFRALGNGFRGTCHDHSSSEIARIRAEVHHPIRGMNDIEIVFDHDHAVAGIGESLEDGQQHPDIVEMKSRGGFVKEKQCRCPSRVRRGCFGFILEATNRLFGCCNR